MTRGGQRERDREKTQAKLAAKGTGGKVGVTSYKYSVNKVYNSVLLLSYNTNLL